MNFEGIAFIVLLGGLSYLIYRSRKAAQLAYIEGYRFNSAIGKKVREKYSHLTNEQIELVLEGLRDYFYICNRAKRRMVAMPSQVVDVAWHEFILFTRPYQAFCKKALGRFLHHTPTEAMKTPTIAQDGIKRAWRLACAKDGIDPAAPGQLPLLFAIDSQLDIEDGFTYSPNCKDKSSPAYAGGYCAGHIGCASGCSGDSGASSDSGGLFDGFGGGSDSSGDGGSGCGGGCGGD